MPDDELLERLQHFHHNAFPRYRAQFQALVQDGQHLDHAVHRLLRFAPPSWLTGWAGLGELFWCAATGAFVPPHDGSVMATTAPPPPSNTPPLHF